MFNDGMNFIPYVSRTAAKCMPTNFVSMQWILRPYVFPNETPHVYLCNKSALMNTVPGGFSTGGSMPATGGDTVEKDAKLANPPASVNTRTHRAQITNQWSKNIDERPHRMWGHY